jgi:hypothetical protein
MVFVKKGAFKIVANDFVFIFSKLRVWAPLPGGAKTFL